MADIVLQQSAIDERQVRIVKKPSHNDQHMGVAGETILRGAPIRLDKATGRWVNAAGGSAANARVTHIAWKNAGPGDALNGLRGCLLDGYVLDGMQFDDPVYLSDTAGTLSTTQGTTLVIVGRVVPGFATTLGNGPDRLLDVATLR